MSVVREFGDNAAHGLVQVVLRAQDLGEDLAVRSDDGGAGVVTGGLDP